MPQSDNPLVKIGGNSGNAEDINASEAGAEHDAAVRHAIKELNRLRQERKALGDDDKAIKQALKLKGLSSRAQAVAKRAAKASKKESPADVLDNALKFLSDETFKAEREELERIAIEKREIAKEERAIKDAAAEKGIELRALPIVRAMQDMDSIERQDFFTGIVNQCNALRYW